jgi:ribonuclease BN (tRNA processing enzyme)
MRFKVLGCSGGIGGELSTTSFLLDDHILLDCGTGVSNLSLQEMKQITSIYFTHSHLDHIAGLPLLVDSIFETLLNKPLQVYGSEATITALQTHIFNNVIWPDFSLIPDQENAVLSFNVLQPGQIYKEQGCQLEIIPVNHVVPTVGYRFECAGGSLAFSADTTTNDSFWQRLNEHDGLDYLLVECAFSNKDAQLCRLARHYCPDMLADDLKKLKHRPQVYISHLKPGLEEVIMKECDQAIDDLNCTQLSSIEVIDLS